MSRDIIDLPSVVDAYLLAPVGTVVMGTQVASTMVGEVIGGTMRGTVMYHYENDWGDIRTRIEGTVTNPGQCIVKDISIVKE